VRAVYAPLPVYVIVRCGVSGGVAYHTRARDAHALVVVVRLLGRVRPALVHHQPPRRVGMAHDGLALAALEHLHREQIGEDRERLVERAALVVAVGEPDRIQHGPKLTMQGEAMKLCQYDEHQAGAVRGERVFPVGAALVAAGHLRPGYTMQEVIEALANRPQAMQRAREALGENKSFPLGSVRLLAPIENPPSIWWAAANYRAHAAEMLAASG